MRRRTSSALLIGAALWWLLWAGAFAQPHAGAASLADFLPKVTAAELVPGADHLGPVQTSPEVAPAYRGQQLVGHVYLTTQYVDTNGYSGKPIHILVGLDTEGTIVGARLVAHSEPIVLIGIPEKKVVTYLQSFVGYNPIKAAATGRGPPHPDIVSGATVTVLVMGESVARSAVRVTRALQQAGAGGTPAPGAASAPAKAAPARVMIDPDAGHLADWKTLLKEGAVRHLHLTVGQVNKAFVASGNAIAAQRPEPGPDDADFIDLYVALVSQPSIGRSLLGDEYAGVSQMLAPGQHAIVVAGDGLYSFKGSGYVRGGIFDRIELVQGAETVRFRDRLHRRVGNLRAEGAPSLREIGVFVIPEGTEFDPTAPWRLQLLVQRATGALDKAFVSFELPYQLPARYIQQSAPAAGGGGDAGPAALPGDDAADPLWRRIWESKAASVVVLALMLGVLTLIFFFQDLLVPREKLFDRIRLGFLAFTLVWLGWTVQAQLSVVNVLTFTTALRTGFKWSSFLVDPLVFILWCSVAAALLFWGRGPFCGWLCPFGALQELANRAAKALKVPQLKIPWRVHERLWPLKYIVFLGLFGVSLGSLAFAEVLAEVEPFKTAIVLRFMRDWWFVLFAVALIGAGLFVERFFCRYLCPLGAALALPGRLRMFDWLKRYRECGNPCMRCFKECPVEAIHPEGHINPNECISCLHCQVLYHHDKKCPVRIQRRLKRERREATAVPPLAAGPAGIPVIPIHPADSV
ncbi:MAG: regulatory protein NosR [Rhizobacter sp.]|nr:regulatory protein NosR [Rhizobacter sp.]